MGIWKSSCIHGSIYIYKGKEFHINGKLSIKVYQKPENKYMYIPYKKCSPKTYNKKLHTRGVKKVRQDKYRGTQFSEN